MSSRFNGEDFPAPLYLTKAAKESRFFQYMPERVLHDLETKSLAMENHQAGMGPLPPEPEECACPDQVMMPTIVQAFHCRAFRRMQS